MSHCGEIVYCSTVLIAFETGESVRLFSDRSVVRSLFGPWRKIYSGYDRRTQFQSRREISVCAKKAVQVGIMESRALFQVWEPQTLCELKSVWGKSHKDGIWQTMCLAVFPGGPCKGGRSHTGCGRCSSPDDSGGSRQGNE